MYRVYCKTCGFDFSTPDKLIAVNTVVDHQSDKEHFLGCWWWEE